MDWYTFLKFAHIFGTVLGVGGSTFAEIFYIKFKKDSQIDPLESNVLKTCYSVLRWGLALLVFSGFGYLILWRLNYLGPDVFYNPGFLAKMTIILVLLFVSFLMNFKRINLELGSTIAITSWYAAMILGIWRSIQMSYFGFLFWYLVGIVVAYFFLGFLRKAIAKQESV
jgi:hypothetical protein